jgi:hypothetical protein
MTLRLDPQFAATVFLFSDIDDRHTRTGEWARTWSEDFAVDGIAQVAVCKLPDESGYNLLCLNAEGHVVFDSAHDTMEQARAYAEVEFGGLRSTWQSAL